MPFNFLNFENCIPAMRKLDSVIELCPDKLPLSLNIMHMEEEQKLHHCFFCHKVAWTECDDQMEMASLAVGAHDYTPVR
jgi:hypothetical protein